MQCVNYRHKFRSRTVRLLHAIKPACRDPVTELTHELRSLSTAMSEEGISALNATIQKAQEQILYLLQTFSLFLTQKDE